MAIFSPSFFAHISGIVGRVFVVDISFGAACHHPFVVGLFRISSDLAVFLDGAILDALRPAGGVCGQRHARDSQRVVVDAASRVFLLHHGSSNWCGGGFLAEG